MKQNAHNGLEFAAFCLGLVLVAAGCATAPKKAAGAAPYAFWPRYPAEPRLQFLVSLSRSVDVAPKQSRFQRLIFGREPQAMLSLDKPYGVAMWKGRIYACDVSKGLVSIFDLRQKQSFAMGLTGPDRLQRPNDIAIAEDGSKYVSDMGSGAVSVFDEQDRAVGRISHPGLKPAGVAVYKDELYVTDFGTQKVEVYSRATRELLRTIGAPGDGPGQFVRPLGIDVDTEGNAYVVDLLLCRVQKFDRQGKLLSSFGRISTMAGGMVRPKQVAVDKEGIVYVVDAAFQNVQLLDQQGRPLTSFGASGRHPGAMDMPAGIAIHEGDLELFQEYVHPAFEAQRLVLVTNQFGDKKVSVYAFGRLKAGHAVAELSGYENTVPSGQESGKPTDFLMSTPEEGGAAPSPEAKPVGPPAAEATPTKPAAP